MPLLGLLAGVLLSVRPAFSAAETQTSELKRRMRGSDPAEACQARAELASRLRGEGKLEAARKLTAEFAALEAGNVEWPRCLVFIEAARTEAAGGALAPAIQALNYADTHSSGLPQVLALEALGGVLGTTEQTEKAANYLRQALQCGDEFFRRRSISETDVEPPKPLDDEWRATKARITAGLRELDDRLAIEKYGVDYVFYRQAQELRLAGKLAEAAARYRELMRVADGSIYAAAADYWLGWCAPEQGDRTARTIEYFEAFVKREPANPYAGEAMCAVGTLLLRERWAPAQAVSWFERCIEWCGRTAHGAQALKLYTVPEKSRAIATPPAENESVDEWGTIHDREMPPDKLLNHVTAAWYLPDLEKRARYGQAFCQMATGNWEEAARILSPVPDLDPRIREAQDAQRPNTYYRLRRCCELKKVVAEDVELDGARPDLRLRLVYADFLYLCQRFDEAKALYAETLELGTACRNPAARAVALVGLGEVAHMRKAPETAVANYRQAIKECPRQKATARACFNLANLLSQLPNELEMREAVDLYTAARKLAPDTCYAENSLAFSIPSLLRLGRMREARENADRLVKDYPKHDWPKMVDHWFEVFGKAK